MFTVLKPFPHPTRRISAGDTVTEADLAGCVIDVADLKKRKFIAGAETKAAEAAAEPAEAAAEPASEGPKSKSRFG